MPIDGIKPLTFALQERSSTTKPNSVLSSNTTTTTKPLKKYFRMFELLINCKVMSYWYTVTASPLSIVGLDHASFSPSIYLIISNEIINSSLVGVIIGNWKFYNHQGLCFNSKLESCISTNGLLI
ncbi:hypothetical protein H8356DRAFT_1364017 [Neocallimastix lanati (nom. inval.)]|nr:hypothetical protein H8356DRAFT_1364017 [Neocallimastix sp. JGI-2020a]